jgi:hypothetical protein
MNASTRTLLLCTALIGAAGMAQAQSTGLTRAAIETAYAEYERLEIAFGPTQVKVEAMDAQSGRVVEAIYDRATGVILKQETSTFAGTLGSGIEIKNRAEDFLRVRAADGSIAAPRGESLDDSFDDDDDDDDGIDDTTGSDDSDDDDQRSAVMANAGGASDEGNGRGRGRSGDDGSDDDRGSDRSGNSGSDNDDSDGDDD